MLFFIDICEGGFKIAYIFCGLGLCQSNSKTVTDFRVGDGHKLKDLPLERGIKRSALP